MPARRISTWKAPAAPAELPPIPELGPLPRPVAPSATPMPLPERVGEALVTPHSAGVTRTTFETRWVPSATPAGYGNTPEKD